MRVPPPQSVTRSGIFFSAVEKFSARKTEVTRVRSVEKKKISVRGMAFFNTWMN